LSRSLLSHTKAHATIQSFDNGGIILLHYIIDDVNGVEYGLFDGCCMDWSGAVHEEGETEWPRDYTMEKCFEVPGHVDAMAML